MFAAAKISQALYSPTRPCRDGMEMRDQAEHSELRHLCFRDGPGLKRSNTGTGMIATRSTDHV